MSAWNLRRLQHFHALERIHPNHLLQFLLPFQDYLVWRGLEWPAITDTLNWNYEQLIRIFQNPQPDTPKELLDGLFFIDQTASPELLDQLQALEPLELNLDSILHEHTSPEDLAVQIWCLQPQILERLQAVMHLQELRTLQSFQSNKPPTNPVQLPNFQQLRQLEQLLDNTYEERKRGRGCRVLAGERPDELWFLIRYPELFQRTESLQGQQRVSLGFRPLRQDVVLFQQSTGELRINAKTNWAKDLYRTEIGQLLLQQVDPFPDTNKYTLDPLRELGEEALQHHLISGIESIVLREIQVYHPGQLWTLVTTKATNLFRRFDSLDPLLSREARIVKATFSIRFTGARADRTVTIKPGNVAQYTRDEDSEPVERWLTAQGFVNTATEDDE